MPIDILYGQPTETECSQAYAAALRSRLELAFKYVRQLMGHQLQRQKEFYDRKVHGEPYSEGSLVWLCSPVVSKKAGRKLHLPWTGPYKVVRRISPVTYRIQHIQSPRKRLVVHFDRLKPCPPDIRISNYSSQPRQSRPLHSPSTADEYDVTLVPFPEVSALPNTPHSTITNSPSTHFHRYPRRIRCTVIILKIRQTSFGKLNFLVEIFEENCRMPV